MQTQKQNFNGLEWVNIINPDQSVALWLQSLHVHPVHIEDALATQIHSKFERHRDYILLTLRFPLYNPKTREIKPSEVDIFVFPHMIVTMHNNAITALNAFFHLCREDSQVRARVFGKGSYYLLYLILEKLLDRSMPMLEHISADMDNLQKRIFNDSERSLVEEVLLIQRNIIDMFRIFKPQTAIFESLANSPTSLIDPQYRPYFQKLTARIDKLRDILSSYKETIEVVRQAHESLVNKRSSKALKVLTIYSLLTTPLTFFLYQVPWHIPALQSLKDNHIVFGSVIVTFFGATIGLVAFLRFKKWL